MKCPECGIEIPSSPCERCLGEKARLEKVWRSVISEFSLREGPPKSATEQCSLDAAVASMRKHLDAEGFEGEISFDAHRLLRSRRWWYVPFRWIGCGGFIVNDEDQLVNWLGSAIGLSDCFWGHDRGIVHELVDLTIHDVSDATVLLSLFRHMKRQVPSRYEPPKQVIVWYLEPEIPRAIVDSYPRFQDLFAWHAIPEIRRLSEAGDLSFTCTPATSATTRQSQRADTRGSS